MERFARQWKEHTEALHRLEQQASALQAECASLASFLPSLTKQEEEAKGVHEKHQATYTSLRAERQKLLDGQSADGAEQAYQRRMEQLKARLKHLLDTQNEQHAVAEQTRGIVEQIARELSDATTDLSAKRNALAAWEAAFRETAPEGQRVEQLLDGVSRERTELAFRLRTQAENRNKVSGLQKVLDKRRTERRAMGEAERLNRVGRTGRSSAVSRKGTRWMCCLVMPMCSCVPSPDATGWSVSPAPLRCRWSTKICATRCALCTVLSGGESFLVSLALALGCLPFRRTG